MQQSLSVVAILVCSVASAQAARTIAVDHPVTLRLEHNQTTAVLLPEPIASMSTGIPPAQLSSDYDGPYLFLIPLDPALTGRLFLVGTSGKLYLLTVAIGTPSDDIVTLTAPRPPSEAITSVSAPLSLSHMLRGLRTQTPLPGEQPLDLPAPTVPETPLTLVSAKAVAWGTTIGLTVMVRNSSPEPQIIDVAHAAAGEMAQPGVARLTAWVFPPRLTVMACAVEHPVLDAGAQTRVFILLQRRP